MPDGPALRDRLRTWLSSPELLPAVLATGMLFVLLALWQRVALISTIPRLPLVVASVAILILSAKRTPALALLLLAVAASSLLWSVAPGNTLVWVLWAAVFVAAMSLGRWPAAFVAANVILLYVDLEKALALNYFGLESYLSGSVHYITGAQALILIPLAFVGALRARRWWVALAWYLTLVLATYGALISGARAVYVPLLVLAVAVPVRALTAGARWYRTLGLLVLLVVGLWGFDTVIPKEAAEPAGFGPSVGTDVGPAASPLANALGTKASLEAQAAGIAEYGGVRNRLRLWHQAITAGLANPLGTGAGSFPTIIHTYQLYPMAWSNSAHNVFFELFAELGWLGALLLMALVLVPLVVVFFGPGWPIALSLFGVWFTLAVDVTASHAYMMALAFATLGATYRCLPKVQRGWWRRLLAPAHVAASVAVVTVVVAVALWWYLPCNGAGCATDRYLGYPEYAADVYRAATPEERPQLRQALRTLYPQSLWVVHLARSFAATDSERLELTREIATRFPYQSPENYLQWAQLARRLGDPSEARLALERGLAIFPPDRLPFSEFRLSPDQYRTTWIEPATALLAELQ